MRSLTSLGLVEQKITPDSELRVTFHGVKVEPFVSVTLRGVWRARVKRGRGQRKSRRLKNGMVTNPASELHAQ